MVKVPLSMDIFKCWVDTYFVICYILAIVESWSVYDLHYLSNKSYSNTIYKKSAPTLNNNEGLKFVLLRDTGKQRLSSNLATSRILPTSPSPAASLTSDGRTFWGGVSVVAVKKLWNFTFPPSHLYLTSLVIQ